MAAIRHTIQKEVFSPVEERLVGLVNVTKPGRKKKTSFLCVSVNPTEKPPQVFISRVKSVERKASDKGDREQYRRVKQWRLSELRLIDGKSADMEMPEFDLHFDKAIFKWIASSVTEKKTFITCLYKLVHKYVERKKPEFLHVDEERLQEMLHSIDPTRSRTGGTEDVEEVEQEEYQELTQKEEEDLENLLSRDNAIQDAAAFTENLSEELAQLDDANIHTLMGSEAQIQELMGNLDQALKEVEQMETKLGVYDELLTGVRETMQRLGSQYSRILVESKNLGALLNEVEELVTKLDLDPMVEKVLTESPLTGSSHIRDCTQAALTLQAAISQELSQGVSILQAVTEQKQFFSNLSFTFGRRLHEELSKMFVSQASQMLEAVQIRHTSIPAISSHSSLHGELLPYSELTKWLRDSEPLRFSEVMEAYIRNLRRVYEEEIKTFISDVRATLARGTEVKKTGLLARVGSQSDILTSFRSPIGGSMMAISPHSRGGGGISASIADFSMSSAYSSPDHISRPKFDQAFTLVLEQLQPVCVAEQKFCTCFFHFKKPEPPAGPEMADQTDGMEEEEREESPNDFPDSGTPQRRTPNLVDIGDMTGGGLAGVLGQLFALLLPEIEAFITFGERLDSYNTLYLLISVSQRLMFAVESGSISYLDETLKKALVCVKRLFDKFIAKKKQAIEEMKMPRGGKCGILPCVLMFNEFAERAEAIVMGTDRRSDLDKAYLALLDSVFRTLEKVAHEHPKTPPDVIKFENYKKMFDILSRLKIGCLEPRRDEAKRKHRSHRREYVVNCLGRPLEKLSTFFEGVESLIAGGTKANEVGYRLDYSRNELKKCIKEYPGKEVKKGLEKLYRRVEKEVSEEELQVVWGAMQEAFMEQYRRFEDLMQKCYPGANINLEFNMDDITEYFSTISHGQQR